MALCACNCGRETTAPGNTFLHGHNAVGERNAKWRGGRYINAAGYVLVRAKDHPRANRDGHVPEHFLVVERARKGRTLPPKAVIHHFDGDQTNNAPSNLVVCNDQGYHRHLHARQKAKAECGHPNWRQCRYCKQYSPLDLLVRADGIQWRHPECRSSRSPAVLERRGR